MSTTLAAVWPIFALILLGALLRAKNFPSPDFWPLAERLTYYVLFPGLLISTLSGADLGDAPVAAMAAALAGATLAGTLAMALLRRRMAPDGPAWTSVTQGGVRINTYVGLSAAFALYGAQGLALSAVALMTIIPLVNVICVGALCRYGACHAEEGSAAKRLARGLVTNPLIVSCVAGILINALRVELPLQIPEMARILGRAALPLGLLSVGAGLSLASVREGATPTMWSSAIKLLFLPAVGLAVSAPLGVDGAARVICVLFLAVPTSVSSFILARQMGGDHRLMAAIITVQTALSAFSLPLWIALTGA